MAAPVLETRDVTIRFGGHVAVDAVSCSFFNDTLTAIVGPNGAGKTTFFNLISGQLAATSGSIHLDGKEITRLAVADRARRGLGRAFQITNLFPNLTVEENVRLAVQAKSPAAAHVWRRWRTQVQWIERADHYLEAVALIDKRHLPTAVLSHGDKRKLEVALLMAMEPHVMMFDEPTAGMSLDDAPVVLDLIHRLKSERGRTILLVEHKMDVVRRLADRIIVLQNGRLIADGKPEEVIALPVVQDAYLGATPSPLAQRLAQRPAQRPAGAS